MLKRTSSNRGCGFTCVAAHCKLLEPAQFAEGVFFPLCALFRQATDKAEVFPLNVLVFYRFL